MLKHTYSFYQVFEVQEFYSMVSNKNILGKEHLLINSLCFKDYLTIKNSLSTNMEVDLATDNDTRDV